MAARDPAEQLFKENVKAAQQCLIACLYKLEEEWLKRPLGFHLLGMSADSLCQCIEEGFRRFLYVGKTFSTSIGATPVKWAKGQAASVLRKRYKAYRASDVPLAEVLRFLDELAAKQVLQEPLSAKSGAEQTRIPQPVSSQVTPTLPHQSNRDLDGGQPEFATEFTHSASYQQIGFRGKDYDLTHHRRAAAVVRVLHEALQRREQTVATGVIRTRIDVKHGGNMYDWFRGTGLWKHLVIEVGRGENRLDILPPKKP